jgi:hypothetical protein
VEHGFAVESNDLYDLAPVKAEHHVPAALQSCHTAIVDGYVIEGHVPAAEIERLLAERPDIVGIGVAGMPIGSPGMEVQGAAAQPFDVIAWDRNGQTQVFASYPR